MDPPTQQQPTPQGGLSKSLGLTDLLGLGIASILGSGGFNLVGQAVKDGGPWYPAALGAVGTLFFGASKVYTEAYKLYKSNTSESDAVKAAFGDGVSKITGLSILGFNLFSVSTILVFMSKTIFPKGTWHGQIGVALMALSAMTAFSLKGIDVNKGIVNFLSACIVGLLTTATTVGLVEGFGPYGPGAEAYPANLSPTPKFTESILYLYFVLAGFDALMKFVEETKEPERDIPRAFYMSNALSLLLVIGFSYAFIHALTLRPTATVNPDNALGTILATALGPQSKHVAHWVGLFLMVTTAFVAFLSITRYLYGIGEEMEEVQWLRELNEEKVPWKAVLVAFLFTAFGIVINHTSTLVKISDFFLTVVMVVVSAAITMLRWKSGEKPWVEAATTAGFAGLFAAWIF